MIQIAVSVITIKVFALPLFALLTIPAIYELGATQFTLRIRCLTSKLETRIGNFKSKLFKKIMFYPGLIYKIKLSKLLSPLGK